MAFIEPETPSTGLRLALGAWNRSATSNNQGELSPLEIGLHALHCVGLGTRGRGNKGDGLASYAGKLGRGKSTISEYRNAAEVSEKCSVDRTILIDKAQQLCAIHSLPESCWPDAVKYVLKHEYSAADTRDAVQKARAAADLEWSRVYHYMRRHGSKPTHPRDRKAFVEAVARGRECDFSNFEVLPDSALIPKLLRSIDVMPPETADALVVLRGSDFGTGARELRRWLAMRSSRSAA